jgi:hypothetical protein
VQYFGELGQTVEVYRNDKITINEIKKLNPEFLVISPGPCTPNEAGINFGLPVLSVLVQPSNFKTPKRIANKSFCCNSAISLLSFLTNFAPFLCFGGLFFSFKGKK